jgi:hypothetical protein
VGAETADAYLSSVSSGTKVSFYQRLEDEEGWLRFAANWLSIAYQQIVDGEKPAQEALDDLQEILDAYRDCIITSGAESDLDAQRTCAEEAGASMAGFLPGRP